MAWGMKGKWRERLHRVVGCCVFIPMIIKKNRFRNIQNFFFVRLNCSNSTCERITSFYSLNVYDCFSVLRGTLATTIYTDEYEQDGSVAE